MLSWLHGGLAVLAGVLGAFIALHHPLWPQLLAVAFAVWAAAVGLRPAIWPFVLPALLPVAGFSAWTGWIGVDEFDLLALGAVAGCQARLAAERWRPGMALAVADPPLLPRPQPAFFRLAEIALAALAISYALALWRGLSDAGSFQLGWFQGYEEPLNSLRVGKSFVLVLLLLPSLRQLQQKAPAVLASRLAAGVATGLGLVSLAILWERSGYPGLLDFSTPYRTTALFWEMHVGGAALDGFLVLALPFAAFAVLRAPNVWRWTLAAALAAIAGYASLTSFSRAVYLAVGVSLALLAGLLSLPWRPALAGVPARSPPPTETWRRWGGRLLLLVLLVEVVAVLVMGSFMGQRLSLSERDLGGRLQHWSEGLDLLRGRSEFLFGRGLGRFPANYSLAVPGRAIPGRLRIVTEPAGAYLELSSVQQRRAAFELLQRLPPLAAGSYTVSMSLRAPQAARLSVAVCQRHLLYDASCSLSSVSVGGDEQQWQHFSRRLSMPSGRGLSDSALALAFLRLRLEGPGDSISIDKLRVVDEAGRELLHNGGFADGLQRWFFAGRHYFVPWHIDNLFLEMLLDQGAIGLLLLLTLLVMAVANLLRGRGREHVLAPYLLAALAASMVLGVFSSLLDMPRPAFLFFLLLCSALFLDGRAAADPGQVPSAPAQLF